MNKFYIIAGWILLVLALISILTGGSDARIIGSFILSTLSFLYAEVEEIKGLLKELDK